MCYTCLVKVRYNKDNFFMSGSQFGFESNSYKDIINLVDIIKSRMGEYLEQYKLPSAYVNYIQLNFRLLDEKFLSEFSLIKPDYLSKPDFFKVKDSLSIPVSLTSLGQRLNVKFKDNIASYIPININDKEINFIDVINKSTKLGRINPVLLDDSSKFYFVKDKVYAIGFIESNVLDKIKFSLSGVIISRVKDTVVNNSIIREKGNKIIMLKNNEILKVKEEIMINPISKHTYSKDKSSFIVNPNIGAIDI